MQVEHRYDATVADIVTVLTDEPFLRARSERFGGDGDPVVRREGALVEVVIPRQLPLEHVPAAFRRFVGDGRLVQTDRWTEIGADRADGTWTTETGRAPIDLSGTHAVRSDGAGCRYVVTAVAKVSLPFAGRLAREVEKHLTELIQHEQQFLGDWLSAHV